MVINIQCKIYLLYIEFYIYVKYLSKYISYLKYKIFCIFINVSTISEINLCNYYLLHNFYLVIFINLFCIIKLLKLAGVERLYPDAKSSLISIYTIVGQELNDPTLLTLSIKNITVKRSKLWEVTFNLKWPEVMSFKEIGKTKVLASKNAAWKCLQWLEINGKLKNGKPIIYTMEEQRNMRVKPIELNVTPEILNNMSELIKTYNTVNILLL